MAYHLYSWKCGGLCYPGAVEMRSREMDNRGSKSIILSNIIVKEQRVDGGRLLNFCIFNNLRYTLRGFERITWSGIPSYQILNKQLYSTTSDSKNLKQKLSKDKDSFSLNPWFITGFTDGDGSFAVSRLPPCFPLSLHSFHE